MKIDYPDHDVVVFNILNYIFIDLIHPDLQQDFLSAQKSPFYQKDAGTNIALGTLINQGLLLSERDAWKRRRKILS